MYLVFCRILAWLAPLTRSRTSLHAELLVLRPENQVLRRTNPKPKLDWSDRFLLAGLIRKLPTLLRRQRLVTPATALAWHHRLVAKHWTYPRPPGRPPLARAVVALIERVVRDNPGWGYIKLADTRRLSVAAHPTNDLHRLHDRIPDTESDQRAPTRPPNSASRPASTTTPGCPARTVRETSSIAYATRAGTSKGIWWLALVATTSVPPVCRASCV